jgi:putative NADH-flavin reductase
MKGDIFSEEELSAHFRGVDAVFSCLGFQRKSVVTGYSDSIKPIVSAMRIANIQRLVVMTAYYTEGKKNSLQLIIKFFIITVMN